MKRALPTAQERLNRAQAAYDNHHCKRCEEDRFCLTLHKLVDRLYRAQQALYTKP